MGQLWTCAHRQPLAPYVDMCCPSGPADCVQHDRHCFIRVPDAVRGQQPIRSYNFSVNNKLIMMITLVITNKQPPALIGWYEHCVIAETVNTINSDGGQ